MSRRQVLVPLRPKRPAEDQIPEPLRTPGPPSCSLDERHSSQPASPQPTSAPMPAEEQPAPPVLPMPMPADSQPAANGLPAAAWPSQVSQSTNTMWLLPAYTDQSSAIAMLLRTEIQSHNITKEMLHATEQRRLEAVRRCERLEIDMRSWSTSYAHSSTALQKCAEEYSRVCADYSRASAEISALKDQGFNAQVLYKSQTDSLRRELSPRAGDAPSETIDPRDIEKTDAWASEDMEYSPCESLEEE
ncbi:hypothetical protein K458DRAFT_311296 [Lentithecium fluviatile CBS 122367]|uniref:Uncharacterized protein n=1 Tax=Lentithecium fluviatile CBS 122367 TaxID=1168545 RepID=A0A6G1IR64_9PLEO|nr:hypothetical protein K458DRAFT_311296 [Lentithecium fluviatile CBS 122367]